MTQAKLIYTKGAHSKSYAYVDLKQTTGKINKNTAFVYENKKESIKLYAYDNYDAGTTKIKLRYGLSVYKKIYLVEHCTMICICFGD